MSSRRGSVAGRDSSRPSSRGSGSARPSTSSSLSSQYVSSFLYRKSNLSSAEIYVSELERRFWPRYIRDIVDTFTRDLAPAYMRIRNTEVSSSLSQAEIAMRDTATVLAAEVAQRNTRLDSGWISVHQRVFGVFSNEALYKYENQRFEVQVGPQSINGSFLSIPVPDTTIGLAVKGRYYRVPTARAPVLSDNFLSVIVRLRNIQPYVAPTATDLAFPCLIFEAKSQSGTLLAAANQAAHGAAKALAMVQTLRDSYLGIPGAPAAPRLPAIVICSQGCIYEVFLAFTLEEEDLPLQQGPDANLSMAEVDPGTHLVRVWLGAADNLEDMYVFQLLLQNIQRWVLSTWMPTVLGMLEAIKADLVAQEERANVG